MFNFPNLKLFAIDVQLHDIYCCLLIDNAGNLLEFNKYGSDEEISESITYKAKYSAIK